jgi:beta-lactamase regulating signal transducer with metallopeptidase domain
MASGAAFGLPLVVIAAVIARPFAAAATRYRIYAAAFIAAAAFAPLAFIASYLRPAAVISTAAFEHAVAQRAPLAAVALIVLIAAIMVADLAIDLLKLLRIKAHSRVDTGMPLQHRAAPVAASAQVRTPTAIGYLHPRIVVPIDLASRVNADEWQAIVAHENAHLERYDDWTKAMQTAVVRLLWFAPALWALAARLDLERELASDERVLARSFDPRQYAACLVRLAADVRRPHAAPAGWVARSQVAVRVERLLKPSRGPGWFAGTARVAALAAVIGLSGFGASVIVPSSAERLEAPVAHVVIVRARHGIVFAHRPRSVARSAHHRPTPARSGTVALIVPPQPRHSVSQTAPVPLRLSDELLALAPAGPCRTCVMLRRPVTDGPAQPRTRAASQTLEPLPQPAGLTDADDGTGSRGYPWDPDILGAMSTFKTFGPIGPSIR